MKTASIVSTLRRGLPILRQRVAVRGTFSRHVGSTFLVQILTLVISLLNTAIIARRLGPAGKGTIALALLVPAMLALFFGLGVSASNVFFAGSRRLSVAELAGHSLSFALLGTVGAGITAWVLAANGWLGQLLPGVPVWLVALAMLSLPAALLNGFFGAILQGLQQIITANAVALGQGASGLLLTVLLVVGLGWGVEGAVLAAVGATLVGLVVLVVLVQREGGRLRPRWQRQTVRAILNFGLRGYVGNVLQFFNYRLDAFIVNAFLGAAPVGIYGAAVSLAELLWYLPNAVGFAIFPKSAASTAAEMNRFTPRVFRLTLALTAAGAVALALTGGLLVRLVFGPAFAAAQAPLLVLLPGVVLLGGSKVLTNEMAGRGYVHYNSLNAGLALALTISLDLLLIPRLGVTGAALASTLAYAATFAAALVFYRAVSRGAPAAGS
ncbi:MAG: oligosaccharide flippase family protein [Caldilineales bacterium]|nr:oligosaccharide flippase family protein [Caldilineales bacterium]MCW5860222.1 oligosaccharide flippase family protein [Caldilineales bacterium]